MQDPLRSLWRLPSSTMTTRPRVLCSMTCAVEPADPPLDFLADRRELVSRRMNSSHPGGPCSPCIAGRAAPREPTAAPATAADQDAGTRTRPRRRTPPRVKPASYGTFLDLGSMVQHLDVAPGSWRPVPSLIGALATSVPIRDGSAGAVEREMRDHRWSGLSPDRCGHAVAPPRRGSGPCHQGAS